MATLKIPRQTSTANTEDADVDQLLAQAAYIMGNPDEFLTEESVAVEAEIDEAVLV